VLKITPFKEFYTNRSIRYQSAGFQSSVMSPDLLMHSRCLYSLLQTPSTLDLENFKHLDINILFLEEYWRGTRSKAVIYQNGYFNGWLLAKVTALFLLEKAILTAKQFCCTFCSEDSKGGFTFKLIRDPWVTRKNSFKFRKNEWGKGNSSMNSRLNSEAKSLAPIGKANVHGRREFR